MATLDNSKRPTPDDTKRTTPDDTQRPAPHHTLSHKGRTELKICVSGAKLPTESFAAIQKIVAPQKTSNTTTLLLEILKI